jgi:hypothetical protein
MFQYIPFPTINTLPQKEKEGHVTKCHNRLPASGFGSVSGTRNTRFGTSPEEEEAASKICYRQKDINEVRCTSVNWLQLAQERTA